MRYRAQAADARLARAERALDAVQDFPEAIPGLAEWLDGEALDAGEAYGAVAAMAPSTRTTLPEPAGRVVQVRRKRYVCAGHVSGRERAQQFAKCACVGECACAQSYEATDEAPVGSPATLANVRAEDDANRDDLHWAIRNVLADAGLLLTRKQRRNRKRAAARARHKEG